MPRKKQYIESEVIDKAMKLFWRNGYTNTSMQMLEAEMGINKFSIYSSFGNKEGVFLESLKSYKEITKGFFEKFENSDKGKAAIKEFFYDSVEICRMEGNEKGCLITKTYMEFSKIKKSDINKQMTDFMANLKDLIIEKLSVDSCKDKETIIQEANYLLLAKHGLAAASIVNTEDEIKDYIEMTFKHI